MEVEQTNLANILEQFNSIKHRFEKYAQHISDSESSTFNNGTGGFC
jgi:UDP-N-acetylmuramoylalanine-D-glutamate ligase